MSAKDENEMELIKDFLKTKGFKSTLECLEKEETYKKVDQKNSKVRI